MTRPLRIGILLDDWQVDAWECELVRRLIDSPDADLCLVVRKQGGKHGNQSAASRLWTHRRKLFHYTFAKIEGSLAGKLTPPNAFASMSVQELVRDVPEELVQVQRGTYTDRVDEEGLDRIRKHDPDILIRIGFRIIKGGLLDIASLGIWSFHFGDPDHYRGAAPGFWEWVEDAPVLGSFLQVLTDELDGGYPIARSWSNVGYFTISQGLNAIAWKSAVQFSREVSKARAMGAEAWWQQRREEADAPRWYTRRLYREPSNIQMTGYLIRWGMEMAKKIMDDLLYLRNHWHLWIVPGATDIDCPLRRGVAIQPPKDRFWADPHVLRRGADFYIFLEELQHRKGRGTLCVMRVEADGSWHPPEPILPEDTHMSYPFVFEIEGRAYLVPETSARRVVELYVEDGFPTKWKKVRTLLKDRVAADATLWQQDGKWWMFTVEVGTPGMSYNDELFLYYTDDLFEGEWTPHPMNPICSDARCARPAGGLFRKGGRLFRPAQVNTHGIYGKGIRLMEVTELTPTGYSERAGDAYFADWHAKGQAMHTLSYTPGLLVVDVDIRTRRFG